jgi:hypothetical protein
MHPRINMDGGVRAVEKDTATARQMFADPSPLADF